MSKINIYKFESFDQFIKKNGTSSDITKIKVNVN